MKRLSFLVGAILLALFVASCGSTTTTTTGSGSAPAATTAPTTASTAALIHTSTATVGGKSETILTDAKGMSLYYFTPDTAAQTACSGGCAKSWPPLIATGTTATSATPLPGTLSVVTTTNGSQVEYNGHLLYTFAHDTAAGQITGQNVGGKWFVATDSLTALGGSTTKSGYGY